MPPTGNVTRTGTVTRTDGGIPTAAIRIGTTAIDPIPTRAVDTVNTGTTADNPPPGTVAAGDAEWRMGV